MEISDPSLNAPHYNAKKLVLHHNITQGTGEKNSVYKCQEYNFTKSTMKILLFNPLRLPIYTTSKVDVYPGQKC